MSAIRRRTALAGGMAAPFVLRAGGASADTGVIKIGNVTPITGPLAPFGETNAFVTQAVQKLTAGGIQSGGKTYQVQIITRDSQSSASRAADVASELIQSENVDLLLAAGGPDTTNPVADQAEANQVPCITTACPWQAYFFGRHGNPAAPFKYTYHFSFGLEDAIAAFTGLWDTLPTNRKVGALFANDADGNAWGDPHIGFPAALPKAGYTLVDPGRYQPFSNDFSAQIAAFKTANVEIVTGTMLTPDFITFYTQAAQLNFKPKIITVGKALLVPSAIGAVGARARGLSSEVAWSPAFPFTSGLSGQSCAALLHDYVAATGKPPIQLIGLQHALFEVAIDVLKRAQDVRMAASIVSAIQATDYSSITGPVNWAKGPLPNVCKTPLLAGQWVETPDGLKLEIAENVGNPNIQVQTKLMAL